MSGTTGLIFRAFLSTLSLRRATQAARKHAARNSISIHALLAESDQANAVDQILPGHISIHALLAESDVTVPGTRHISQTHFYPRSPCGERQPTLLIRFFLGIFLSTLSLRRATNHNLNLPSKPIISIHALLAESDTFAYVS